LQIKEKRIISPADREYVSNPEMNLPKLELETVLLNKDDCLQVNKR